MKTLWFTRPLHALHALRYPACAVVVALWALSTGAWANQYWEGLHQQVRQGEAVELESLLDWLDMHYVGDVIEVEVERDDGRIEYEIKMLGPQGQVVEFEFDGRNGKLLQIEGARINDMQR